MSSPWPRVSLAALFTVLAALSGCSGDPSDGPTDEAGPRVINVPSDYDTIQAGVDQARPGDTVVVASGIYDETVTISTEDVTLRGEDRNEVVLDGGLLKANGVVALAGGVTIENLTTRNYTVNGVLVTGLSDDGEGVAKGSDGYTRLDPDQYPPLQGFAVRYVTAYNNGLYGVYAFDSQDGVIEQTYTSGNADSGIYVGQCLACDIVVRDNVAEGNAVGYEQANASGDTWVIGNRFTGNRVGLSLQSDYLEAFYPLDGGIVAGNVVSDNDNPQTPAQADGGWGIGIGLAGTTRSRVIFNRADDNASAGIVLTSAEDLAPLGIEVTDNRAQRNGVDIWYAASAAAPGSGNCFAGNRLGAARPRELATWTCPDGNPEGPGVTLTLGRVPRGIPFTDVPAPPDQPTLPTDAPESEPTAPPVQAPTSVPPADLLVEWTRAGAA